MTFTDLVSQISEFKNTATLYPNYLFRGQADNSWGLEPSLTRIAIKRQLTRQETLQLERECINKFSISSRNLLPVENTISLLPDMNGDLDFLGWGVVMQHYSAPTRLLDWSCSPWVALYFACCEQDKDASIFIADYRKVVADGDSRLRTIGKGFYKLSTEQDSQDILHFITSRNTNERIEAQQGMFSACTNPLIDHKQLIKNVGGLHEIVIPQHMKHEIMSELYRMNITAKTLYPGIDGLGKSTYEYCNLWDKRSIIN